MAIFPRGKIYWYKFYFAGQTDSGVVQIDLQDRSQERREPEAA